MENLEKLNFKGKRIFLTGHTGFKGSWLALWLHRLGAKIYGYSLPPPTQPSNYVLSSISDVMTCEWLHDIRNSDLLREAIKMAQPEVVFHLAAQPLVRYSYQKPLETFDINVMGTASLLEALRDYGKPCAVICITTDKCYENREQHEGYRETDPMGGHDPYSASKGAAELLIAAYRRSFFNPANVSEHGVQIASARAGNVIGGGDFAQDRIVVDLVKALHEGRTLEVRNPRAIRPWQHVLEPLSGYLSLANKMLSEPSAQWCEGWNFGPRQESEKTVGELVDAFIRVWGTGAWRDVSHPNQLHEAGILKLNTEKASRKLNWHPTWTFDTMLAHTAQWYQRMPHEDTRARCLADIEIYEQEAAATGTNRACGQNVQGEV